jgi:hypothetical protein
MSDYPEGYQTLAVASMEGHGFNAETGEAVIWLTATNGLKVQFICDAGALHRVLASITDHRAGAVKKAGMRAIIGGKGA